MIESFEVRPDPRLCSAMVCNEPSRHRLDGYGGQPDVLACCGHFWNALTRLGWPESKLAPQCERPCREPLAKGRQYAVRHEHEWHIATWDGECFTVTSDWQSGDRWLPEWVTDHVPLPTEPPQGDNR